MQYLDYVEVVHSLPRYEKENVTIGMRGTIMSLWSIAGTWQVLFSDDQGEDIADLDIREQDLRVVNASNLSQNSLEEIIREERE